MPNNILPKRFLVDVADIESNLSECPQSYQAYFEVNRQKLEIAAEAIFANEGEIYSPFILKVSKYKDGLPKYELVHGEFELAAAITAKKIYGQKLPHVQAVVVKNEDEEKDVISFLKAFGYIL